MKSVFGIAAIALFSYICGVAATRVGTVVPAYEMTAWDSINALCFVASFFVLGYFAGRGDGKKEGK